MPCPAEINAGNAKIVFLCYHFPHIKLTEMAYNLLKGKRGIITGALDSNSIAWKVAEKAHEEGATFVLTNAPIAMRMGEIKVLAEKTGSEIIPADATNVEELTNLFTKSQEVLGGKIDFVLHSIGMSVNIRKNIPYTELNYDYFLKGIDVSALSFHKMLSVARKLDAINEWGSVVALTYMAAQRTYPFYTDMADIKAMLEWLSLWRREKSTHQHRFPVAHQNHGRYRYQRLWRFLRLCQCHCTAG
jgi:enoyl-[acyl-carrier protein] reductase I